MCGIAGYMDLWGRNRVEAHIVEAMTEALVHRGPDSSGYFVEPGIGLGVRRLKIIDPETGDQPIYNEDRSLVMICNGEIFNYRELRRKLTNDNLHVFRSRTDVEVLVHLYEEHGEGMVTQLNGQFGFAVWDRRERRLFLARDHFGINPLYFSVVDGLLLFASEIKAILQHPAAPREIDLVGMDQILSLPGLVSPRTLFKGIESLKSGHSMTVVNGEIRTREYWDLEYPTQDETPNGTEEEYVEELRELLWRSVERRLRADVPVGLFVSGGLDSSLVAALTAKVTPEMVRHSFSITFADREIDEGRFQRLVTRATGSEHHDILVDEDAIAHRLSEMVFHCECPVKETYNTCSFALAEAARSAGITVVLAGQGADELFGGYPGYRFDSLRTEGGDVDDVEWALEEELRERLWGDRSLLYERNQIAFRDTKAALYSPQIAERLDAVDCLNHPLVNKERLRGRHPIHQRSYLDFKLRLADHLLSDHGDRMVMANSVEARYPFLDIELVDLVRRIPPALKVKGLTEKYILKRAASGLVPRSIIEREKFGFRAPGSPVLLQRKYGWVDDYLSFEHIRRQGYFAPGAVERLRMQYSQEGFRLHPHLDTDLLMIVLTFNLLCDQFNLPALH